MSKIKFVYINACLIGFLLILGCLLPEPAWCYGPQSEDMKITSRRVGDSFHLYLTSKYVIPVTFNLSFDVLRNLKSDKKLPLTVVVPAKAKELELLKLTVVDPRVASRYEYKTTYSYGKSRGTSHDDSYLYLLPFEHGTKQFVDQGYFGSYSHTKPGNQHCLDFGIPEGGKICAARGGIVFALEEGNSAGGPHISYAKYGNYINIHHSDGSIARYVHLQQNGAFVEVGEKVKAGQVIGLSGSTGYTKGAHLHFSVGIPDTNTKEGQRTIPTKFLGVNGKAVTLQEGQAYYSFHRGLGSFDVVLGSELTNENYKDYSRPLNETGKVDFRYDTIDRTVIYYIRNGTSNKISVSFDFDTTEDLFPSRKLPVADIIPPLCERYLLLTRPVAGDDGMSKSYRCELRYMPVR